ncbi:hypothetical protein GCM10027168_30720 [Streptomyces capparidis]
MSGGDQPRAGAAACPRRRPGGEEPVMVMANPVVPRNPVAEDEAREAPRAGGGAPAAAGVVAG